MSISRCAFATCGRSPIAGCLLTATARSVETSSKRLFGVLSAARSNSRRTLSTGGAGAGAVKRIQPIINTAGASTFARLSWFGSPLKHTHTRWQCNAPSARQFLRTKTYQSEAEYLKARKERNSSVFLYVSAVGVLTVALSYAAVPLYRMFCQVSGFAGTTGVEQDPEKVANMVAVEDRVLKIKFNADTGARMRWNFKPLQQEVYLVPGETSLAFFSAENKTDEPIIGISTYNVIPYDAGQYFMKIQCFCFEEQRLNPHEQVDMPVFFYIDPEFATDPRMTNINEITLSYTFFKARDDLEISDDVTGTPMTSAGNQGPQPLPQLSTA
eukprot:m.117753 g.117753  ORF g.117753 m.117753 type:complete len:327 (+) comp28603_c0_seq1:122-1102(+)